MAQDTLKDGPGHLWLFAIADYGVHPRAALPGAAVVMALGTTVPGDTDGPRQVGPV